MTDTPRKTRRARMVPLRDEDVPGWVGDLRAPDGQPLVVYLNWAKFRPDVVVTSPHAQVFETLALRAETQFSTDSAALPKLLELAPCLLHHLDLPQCRWIASGFAELFVNRDYKPFADLGRGVGKIGTDHDMAVAATLRDALYSVEDLSDETVGVDTFRFGRLVRNGVTKEQAIADLAAAKNASEETIATAVERGFKMLERFGIGARAPRLPKRTPGSSS